MTQVLGSLITMAAILALSNPSFAQNSPPPMADAVSQKTASPVEEGETSQPTVSEEPPGVIDCHDQGGMAQEPTDALSAFYHAQQSSFVRGEDKITIQGPQGILAVNGTNYKLNRIEVPFTPPIELGASDYKAQILFVHDAPDGSTAIVVVPVREGNPNIGFEKILSGPSENMFDPNEFMPHSRQYMSMGRTFGQDCSAQQTVQYFILVQPITASAGQIKSLMDSTAPAP